MNQKSPLTAALMAALALAVLDQRAVATDAVPGYVSAAMNAPGRFGEERQYDAVRHTVQRIVFATAKPGDKIATIEPAGSVYDARIFSKIVGHTGHVYILVPAADYPQNVRKREREMIARGAVPPTDPVDTANSIINVTDYNNVSVLWEQLYGFGGQFSLPEQLDVVWSNHGYNDWHNKRAGSPDGSGLAVPAVLRALFQSIRPGGVFVVSDARASAGTAFTQTKSLHRADPEAVKAEIEAAGFALDAQSTLLDNGTDHHDTPAGPLSDRYLLRFEKPLSAPADHRADVSALEPYFGNTIHSGIGRAVERYTMIQRDGTYQDYGSNGNPLHAIWFLDAAGRICHVQQYPPENRSFTLCHVIEPGKKVGDEWMGGDAPPYHLRRLERGYVVPPPPKSAQK